MFNIYPPQKFENLLFSNQEKNGLFTRSNKNSKNFTMLLPPPNITGRLHMGHTYEHSLIDATIRFKRMNENNTLLIAGLDHAAIATNALLTKKLNEKGITKEDLGFQGFSDYAWAWKNECESQQIQQMKELGLSANWDDTHFTLDSDAQEITHVTFTKLFNEGYIYQAERETFWCETCKTTLSDIELNEDETCSRCFNLIEIRSSKQWYLKTKTLAQTAIKHINEGLITFLPESKSNEILTWAENMHDWCISRQLWWGHKIPIWFKDNQTRSFAPNENIPDGWIQEEGTLDTWFSSALWPLITIGYPDEEKMKSYPLDMLITGNDLLFFWALRMIMLSTFMTGKPPFKTISFHGMIRDEKGFKMSKSKGNTIDPKEKLDEYGPDILRLALLRKSLPGTDTNLSESDLLTSKALIQKLWSTIRFGENLGAYWEEERPSGENALDNWLLNNLNDLIFKTKMGFEKQNYLETIQNLSDFLNNSLSSFYIEARKTDLQENDAQALKTLSYALSSLLKLLHPLAPFITDLAASELGCLKALDEITYPKNDFIANENLCLEAETLKESLFWIRSIRNKRKISSKIKLKANIKNMLLKEKLYALGKLEEMKTLQGEAFMIKKAIIILEEEKITLDEELKILKQITKLEKDIKSWNNRLNNEGFLLKASTETIKDLKIRLKNDENTLQTLKTLLNK